MCDTPPYTHSAGIFSVPYEHKIRSEYYIVDFKIISDNQLKIVSIEKMLWEDVYSVPPEK